MNLFQKSVLLFLVLLFLVALPSIHFTPLTAGVSLTVGSGLVLWQTFIILTDEGSDNGAGE